MIYAYVGGSGIFSLREHSVSFVDIEQKSELMQEAIVLLASKGILPGSADGFFFPDRMITYDEFVSALVRMFDLIDPKEDYGDSNWIIQEEWLKP